MLLTLYLPLTQQSHLLVLPALCSPTSVFSLLSLNSPTANALNCQGQTAVAEPLVSAQVAEASS